MATKKTRTQVLDRKDGQPVVVSADGYLMEYDPKGDKYVKTGIKVVADDTDQKVNYFRLETAPQQPDLPATKKYNTLNDLDAAMATAEWHKDPLTTTTEKPYCWMISWNRVQALDAKESSNQGHNVFSLSYANPTICLFTNRALSPKIVVDENKGTMTIANPGETDVEYKLPTSSALSSILGKLEDLQLQVDGAIYTYNGKGVPVMKASSNPKENYSIVDSWLAPYRETGKEIPTDVLLKIYKVHVRDVYTDIDSKVAYRFDVRDGGNPEMVQDYGWSTVKDTDFGVLMAAIQGLTGEVGKRTTIWTEKPIRGYKVGDLWYDSEDKVVKVAVKAKEEKDLTGGVIPVEDWVVYATKAQLDALGKTVEALQKDLKNAKSNINTASESITALTGDLNSYKEKVEGAFKDGIITEQEKKILSERKKMLEAERDRISASYLYLKDNPSIPSVEKTKLDTAKSEFDAAVNGLIGKIDTAIADSKITDDERQAVETAFATYKQELVDMQKALEVASDAIARMLVSQKSVRNLLTLEHMKRIKLYKAPSDDQRYYFIGRVSDAHSANVLGDGTASAYKKMVTGGEVIFSEKTKYTLTIPFFIKKAPNAGSYGGFQFVHTDGSKSVYMRFPEVQKGEDKFGVISTSSDPTKTVSYIEMTYSVGGDVYMSPILSSGESAEWSPAPEDAAYLFKDVYTKAEADGVITNSERLAIAKSLSTMVKSEQSYNDARYKEVVKVASGTALSDLTGAKSAYDVSANDLIAACSSFVSGTDHSANAYESTIGSETKDKSKHKDYLDKAKSLTEKLTVADRAKDFKRQYSKDGNTAWHDAFSAGDLFARDSTDGGKTWTAAIRVVGEDGVSGSYVDYSFAKLGLTATAEQLAAAVWADAPPMNLADNEYIWQRAQKKKGSGENDGLPTYLRLTGVAGDDAVIETIDVEGYFKTSWEYKTANGVLSATPEKVTRVVGAPAGVNGVRITGHIWKGGQDVIDKVKNSIKWYVGGVNKANGVTGFVLTINDHSGSIDGVDDIVEMEYDDATL